MIWRKAHPPSLKLRRDKGCRAQGKAQIMIRVNLYTILGIKDIIGEREIEIDVPDNSNLSDLIAEIIKRWGNGISEVLLEPESKKVKAHLRLMVNGQDISFLEGLDTKLNDGDEVMIFPPVSGG